MKSFVSCLSPQWIINPYTKEMLVVPCGKCLKCLQTRQNTWVNRLKFERDNWKHCVFFTLTYSNDFLPVMSYDDILSSYPLACEALEKDFQSSKLFEFYNGIPYFKTSDIQNFIKRLRKWLFKHEEIEKSLLRYYVVVEYGPTSFRPHCHGILFFNSDLLANSIKERVDKAWSDYNPVTHTWKSFGRFDAQFVIGDSFEYVAKYTSFISSLPKILQFKPFAPKCYCSTRPPIGSNWLGDEKVRQIFTRGLTEYTIRNERTGEFISLPLPRTLKNKLYPKIKGFYKLSSYDRIALYRLGYLWQDLTSSQVVTWFKECCIWKDLQPVTSLLCSLFGSSEPSRLFEPFNENSFKTFVYQVKRVCFNASFYHLTISDYVQKISDFYSLSDYNNLIKQLKYEESYCDSIPKKDIKYLPFLIDQRFAGNGRELPLSTYDSYLFQFGYKPNEFITCTNTIFNSPEYLTEFKKLNLIYSDNHKNRARNEYLDMHPELKSLHYQILKN